MTQLPVRIHSEKTLAAEGYGQVKGPLHSRQFDGIRNHSITLKASVFADHLENFLCGCSIWFITSTLVQFIFLDSFLSIFPYTSFVVCFLCASQETD